jgi:hypothetical protein
MLGLVLLNRHPLAPPKHSGYRIAICGGAKHKTLQEVKQ